MAAKLGEMLVNSGILNQKQLDEALKNHLIFGGRIGTNLIELGYLNEEELARFLSEKLGVPCIDPARISEIPEEVIKIIPANVAKKYGVIPLSVEKKKLTLLMADPSDFSAIDELSFITGFIIKPVIIPEVRLILALEKYYKIERDVRYIPIIQRSQGSKDQKKRAQEPAQKESDEKVSNISSEEDEYLSEAPADMYDLSIEPEQSSKQEESPPEDDVTDGNLMPSQDNFTLDDVARELSNSQTRDEIADIVMVYVGQEFDRAALFFVKKEDAIGWKAVNKGSSCENFSSLKIPFSEPSILREVSSRDGYYMGAVPDTPFNVELVNKLGGEWPSDILLLPILMMGKLVSILYLDGDREKLEKKLPGMQRLTYKTAMAFDILILKSKIMRV